MPIAKLVEAGADWFTGTSQSQQSADLMADVWQQMLKERDIKPKDIHKAAWFGYYGWRCEHSFYGTREDQACVTLSGMVARIYAESFYEVGARPSRLDLQATYEIGNIGAEIQAAYDDACAWQPKTGRPPKVTCLYGRDKRAETLYVGRRASEVFVRCYDKEKESRDRFYQGCIRLEVELKSHTARKMAARMQEDSWSYVTTLGLLKGFLVRYGINFLPLMAITPIVERPQRLQTSTEGKMAWLMQQVSPTVQALLDEVGWAQVASVLFPDGLQTHNADGMLDASGPSGRS